MDNSGSFFGVLADNYYSSNGKLQNPVNRLMAEGADGKVLRSHSLPFCEPTFVFRCLCLILSRLGNSPDSRLYSEPAKRTEQTPSEKEALTFSPLPIHIPFLSV